MESPCLVVFVLSSKEIIWESITSQRETLTFRGKLLLFRGNVFVILRDNWPVIKCKNVSKLVNKSHLGREIWMIFLVNFAFFQTWSWHLLVFCETHHKFCLTASIESFIDVLTSYLFSWYNKSIEFINIIDTMYVYKVILWLSPNWLYMWIKNDSQ